MILLSEGGSAPGVGPIHRDEIEATLAPLERALGIKLYDNMLVVLVKSNSVEI